MLLIKPFFKLVVVLNNTYVNLFFDLIYINFANYRGRGLDSAVEKVMSTPIIPQKSNNVRNIFEYYKL